MFRFLFSLGGDGGSIPLRQDLVKLKSKSEVLDPEGKNVEDICMRFVLLLIRFFLKIREVVQRIRWSSCALSKQTLQAPIVADELGNLFNKEVSFL